MLLQFYSLVCKFRRLQQLGYLTLVAALAGLWKKVVGAQGVYADVILAVAILAVEIAVDVSSQGEQQLRGTQFGGAGLWLGCSW